VDLERAILQVLDEVTPPNKRIGSLEYDQVVDTERHHCIVVHMDIRDGLVWLGIPKNKIVLGWQSPFTRKYSGYATGEAVERNGCFRHKTVLKNTYHY
jgi:XisI protein